ncbi:MAG: sialidase family protein [Gemmataceae bacterium]
MLSLYLLASAVMLAPPEPTFHDVFNAKTDDFISIRIPSIVCTSKGTLLAFAEGRSAPRDHAKNKIVMKRSDTGGRKWSDLLLVADAGDRSLNNPCAVVDRSNGRILLVFQMFPANVSERSKEIVPGVTGESIVKTMIMTSDDDGMTWTKPRDITAETKRPEKVTTVASGPGIGIQLRHGPHAGRILIPFNEGPYGIWNIYCAYSDDHSEHWKMGEIAPGGMIEVKGKPASTVNEAQIVELADGKVRWNVRRWNEPKLRKTGISSDGGQTWSKVEEVKEQIDPSCMASILRYSDPADGRKNRILFSGPQSTKREKGTLFLSRDDGKTWPVSKQFVPGFFAYSCLVALPDGTIGCLYENEANTRISFARISLDWLTDGQDSYER